MNKKINTSQYHSDTITKDIRNGINKPIFKHNEIKISDVECALLSRNEKSGDN